MNLIFRQPSKMAVPHRVISAREDPLGFVAGARDGSVLPGTRRAVAFEPVVLEPGFSQTKGANPH